ncbi:MAG: hypothetical protein DKM50_07810 [Candidatus Margulisiibacteriota bacterium]|nr:MAG: hypothetical protein A2X43_05255 [Candidatus Margulisbacteria bacterium GWD2_39_127]OGI02625.1 MAG: hypothetical protein A2X42_10985 [Candidatus Margulisbacteria bacterium GWF2_38_17]OGI07023.1 MAG: hypothetical protein A2X41_11745 [Candidatus Margulisbacteria bacterium GWE2_39_32]PZM79731.1 MAG: hypothetical protein DKM50_07810 [Candidatus Margulisiibacteriota bacterium]HAR63596.1 hypothetical protein [Candidatus Margulisiibacteriota bacterium]
MKQKNIIVLVFLCFLLLGIVSTGNCAEKFSRKYPVLIKTNDLEQIIDDKNLVIIDCRTPELYRVSHIKGAINLYTRDIYDHSSPIENIIPPLKELAELFGSNGINTSKRVVVYEKNSDAREAARMILYLESCGHDKVQFLDGGINKWLAEKREKTSDLPQITKTQFKLNSQPQFIVSKDYVLSKLNKSNVLILDARGEKEYSGQVAGSNVKRGGGHIPGAINNNYKELIDEDGKFSDKAVLTKMFKEAGLNANINEVIIYCRTAVRSSLVRMALKHIVGFENTKVYDGAMVEWSVDPSCPLVK